MGENNQEINSIHTFWIFGLGMGIGQWLIGGTLKDLLGGFFLGIFAWFILLITIWPAIFELSKWIKKKLKYF